MAEIIIHDKGVFNVYSTISDRPLFDRGITQSELKEYIKEGYGNHGLETLNRRIDLAKRKGTSALLDQDLEETLICNRAGKDESTLPYEVFIAEFLS